MLLRPVYCIVFFFLIGNLAAQDSTLFTIRQIPSKYLDATFSKADKFEEKLNKKTEKFLAAMRKEENKLKNKLYKIDSLAANNLFSQSAAKYEEFQNKLLQKNTEIIQGKIGNYIPFLDTMKTSLNFLQNNLSALLPGGKEVQDRLRETIGKVDLLKVHAGEKTISERTAFKIWASETA